MDEIVISVLDTSPVMGNPALKKYVPAYKLLLGVEVLQGDPGVRRLLPIFPPPQ